MKLNIVQINQMDNRMDNQTDNRMDNQTEPEGDDSKDDWCAEEKKKKIIIKGFLLHKTKKWPRIHNGQWS